MNKSEINKIACLESRNAIFLNQNSQKTENHLQSCEDCQRQKQELQDQATKFRSIIPEYPPFRPDWEKLNSFIKTEEQQQARAEAKTKNAFSGWLQLFGNLALNFVLLFIIVSGFYFCPPEPNKIAVEQQKFVVAISKRLERLSLFMGRTSPSIDLKIKEKSND